MAPKPTRKPVAMKTVTRATAKKVTTRPTVKPKTSNSLKTDVARAKATVNKKRAATSGNGNRLVRKNANVGLTQRMKIQDGLGTSLSRAGNFKAYGINSNKFKDLNNLAGDTVGEGDRESAYWKKSSVEYLTNQALKMGVAKDKRGAKIAAQYIVKSIAQEQANIYSEEARINKKNRTK